MTSINARRFVIAGLALAIGLFAFTATDAQETKSNGIAIEPYEGPPVFLPEGETPPEPRFVENTTHTEKYEDGAPRIIRSVARYSDDSLVSDGPYREFYANGQQFVEGSYSHGEPDGEWTYWHDNGEVCKTVRFEEGKPGGVIEVHRPDGTLEAKRSYSQGKKDGQWLVYNDAGKQILREETYSKGARGGTWKWWYPSGQLMREANFQEDVPHGETKEWSEEGELRATANFKKGKRHGPTTQWKADGTKIEQLFKEGKRVAP